MGSKDLADGSVSYRGNKKKGVADRLKDILGLSRSPNLTTLDDERFERTQEPQANFWRNIPKKRETFTLDDFKDLKIEELPKVEIQEHEWVRIEETEDVEPEIPDSKEDIHIEPITDVHETELKHEYVMETAQDVPDTPSIEVTATGSPKQNDEAMIDDYFDFLPPMRDAVRRPAGSRVAQEAPAVEITPKTVFDFDEPISDDGGTARPHIRTDTTVDTTTFEETPIHAVTENEPAEAETMTEVQEPETAVATESLDEPVMDAEPMIETTLAYDVSIEEPDIIEETTADIGTADIEEVISIQGRHVNVELNFNEIEEVATYVPNFILVDADDVSTEAAVGPHGIELEIESVEVASEADVPVSADEVTEEDSLDTVLPYEVLRAFDSEEDVPEVELNIGLTDVEDDYIEIVVDEEDRITTAEPKAEAAIEAGSEIEGSGVMFDFFSPSAEMTDSRISMTFGVESSGMRVQEQPVVEMKEENVIYL